MADAAFYDLLGPVRLGELARAIGAEPDRAESGDVQISGVASLDEGGPGCLGFALAARRVEKAPPAGLAACIVKPDEAEKLSAKPGFDAVPFLITPWPQGAFVRACDLLVRPKASQFGAEGVHPEAELGEGAEAAPGARIAAGAKIGARARIGPNAVIGAGVEIGADCEIGPGAVVMFARIGARTVIRSGAVIGEAGFGLGEEEAGLVDLPHLGRVLIDENVTIGANSTIDRGMFADTLIGAGSKIDNLVQVAHNVVIGRNCVLAGCCGISGSAVIEDGAMLGGSVGVSDHVRIGAGARLAGATLVMRDVPPGEAWAGAPAKPIKQFFRETVAVEKLAQRKPKA